jgi:uncharacterized membrane protein
MTIRNPIEWTADAVGMTRAGAGAATPDPRVAEMLRTVAPPAVRKIGIPDLQRALAEGYEDFGENRTDVIFLCFFYPIVGLVLARFASGTNMLPLIFPLASGFALLGPLAGVGLYEMSRRREQGRESGWTTAFGVARLPSFGSVIGLGVLLFVIYALWLVVAWGIYAATLGPQPPASTGAFLTDVFTTGPGWAMIILGMGVGFIFACVVLTITAVSFPMLLDRNVGVGQAIATSIKVVRLNPVPMAIWGLIVAGGLVIGSIPLFVGLIFVLPVLGHATWHLYRKVVSA